MSYAVAVDRRHLYRSVAYDHANAEVIYAKSPTTYENLSGVLDCFKSQVKRRATWSTRHHPGHQLADSAPGREDGLVTEGFRDILEMPAVTARSFRSPLSARSRDPRSCA
jgi:hypothetical protein